MYLFVSTILPGYQTCDSASSSKFQHLASLASGASVTQFKFSPLALACLAWVTQQISILLSYSMIIALQTLVDGSSLSSMKDLCPRPQPEGKFLFRSTPRQLPQIILSEILFHQIFLFHLHHDTSPSVVWIYSLPSVVSCSSSASCWSLKYKL